MAPITPRSVQKTLGTRSSTSSISPLQRQCEVTHIIKEDELGYVCDVEVEGLSTTWRGRCAIPKGEASKDIVVAWNKLQAGTKRTSLSRSSKTAGGRSFRDLAISDGIATPKKLDLRVAFEARGTIDIVRILKANEDDFVCTCVVSMGNSEAWEAQCWMPRNEAIVELVEAWYERHPPPSTEEVPDPGDLSNMRTVLFTTEPSVGRKTKAEVWSSTGIRSVQTEAKILKKVGLKDEPWHTTPHHRLRFTVRVGDVWMHMNGEYTEEMKSGRFLAETPSMLRD